MRTITAALRVLSAHCILHSLPQGIVGPSGDSKAHYCHCANDER
jgi:hypothetical protein